jgi:hypothetical protein
MKDEERVSKAEFATLADGGLLFLLGKNQVGYLQNTLLHAYRDDAAEVNHVHVQGERAGQTLDLTVMFDIFATPLSPEEAEQLLRREPSRGRR